MTDYEIRWITPQLAVGHAPMSYEQLREIEAQGITSIVNLCGEYCDLHQIEEGFGFEVFYLPIPDDDVPDLSSLENALDWVDEALYLGKKVLIHCRLGIGRTGTFVTSYLLRRGFALKAAQKRLKTVRSSPTSFRQWRLVRKYKKQEKPLTVREPSLEGKNVLDLAPYFAEYEALVEAVERGIDRLYGKRSRPPRCGLETSGCCSRLIWLQFIEAAYVNHHFNRYVPRAKRLEISGEARSIRRGQDEKPYFCPLFDEGMCLVYDERPLACRLYGVAWESNSTGDDEIFSPLEIKEMLREMSGNLFFMLNGLFLKGRSLLFPLPDVVAGRFVQDYFQILVDVEKNVKRPT